MRGKKTYRQDPLISCFVPSCKVTALMSPDKYFFFIPLNTRKEWCAAVNKTNVPKGSVYICEDHINVEDDLLNYNRWRNGCARARLKPEVPFLKNILPTSAAVSEHSEVLNDDIGSSCLPNDMENYMKYHLMGHVSQVRMKPGCIPTKFSCQVRKIDRKRPNILKHKKPNVNYNEEYVKMSKESHMVTIEIDFEEASSGNSAPSKEKYQQVLSNNRSKTTEKSNRAHMTKTSRSKANGTKIRLIHQVTSPKKHQHSVSTAPFKKNHVNNNLSKSSSKEQDAPGPSGGLSETPLTDPGNLDPSTGLEDPLATEPPHRTPQCRLCAEFSEDCVDVTDEDRPYLTRNKTTMTLNHLSVELDFNDALPKTVCRVCDEKLQGMFDFLKQVKEAQDSLNNFRDYAKEDDLIVKTECESPIPDDNCDIGDDTDDIDSKDYIVDSITETETVFVKPVIKHKRKLVEVTPKTHKKPKVTEDVKSDNADFIVDIKEENVEMVDAYEVENVEFDDTEIDTQPSELELETLLRLMK